MYVVLYSTRRWYFRTKPMPPPHAPRDGNHRGMSPAYSFLRFPDVWLAVANQLSIKLHLCPFNSSIIWIPRGPNEMPKEWGRSSLQYCAAPE